MPEEVDSPELDFVPDPKLVAEGWVRRSLADPGRVDEVRELYESLGFEVIVRRVEPQDLGAQCKSCAESVCGSYVTVYTRKG